MVLSEGLERNILEVLKHCETSDPQDDHYIKNRGLTVTKKSTTAIA